MSCSGFKVRKKSRKISLSIHHICAVGSAKWFQLDITPLDAFYRLKE